MSPLNEVVDHDRDDGDQRNPEPEHMSLLEQSVDSSESDSLRTLFSQVSHNPDRDPDRGPSLRGETQTRINTGTAG